MSFSINNNASGLFSSKNLQQTQQKLLASIERLSSGKRSNQGADDAAGLAIADNLGSQARGYGMSIRNANDAISIAQVADGALGQASELPTFLANSVDKARYSIMHYLDWFNFAHK